MLNFEENCLSEVGHQRVEKMGKVEPMQFPENYTISKEEEHLILQLKENVKDVLPENVLSKSVEDQRLFFVRWIRAREHNLEKATDMLRNHLQWRVERNADEILKITLHPFFRQNYPYDFVGVDRKGQPVICFPYSEWDFRKIVNDKERLSEFDEFVTHTFESAMNFLETEHNNRASGHPPITQLIFVIDAKDFPYGQLVKYSAIKKIVQLAGTYEAHYPEILYKGICINCPSYFGLFMNLIKPILAPKTYSKIKLYSSKTKWQEDIGELMDPAIIPERYGGTLKVDS